MAFTEEQLAERRTRINASEVAAILGISPFSTPWEIWADKVGKLTELKQTKPMYYGSLFESSVLDHAENELGMLKRQPHFSLGSGLIHATPDALVIDNPSVIVEAKCSMIVEEWGDEGTSDIPDYYMVQVQTQMLCAGASECRVFCVLGKFGIRIQPYVVPANEDIQNYIVRQMIDWWEKYVVGSEEPDYFGTSLETAKRIRKVPASTCKLGGDAVELWDDLQELTGRVNERKKDIQSMKAGILLMLDSNEAGQLPDGRMITNYEQTRRGYEVAETSYRVLREVKAQ